jgi:putative polyketide hydroxylase
LNIIDVKFWKMKNVVIDKWTEDKIFVIGDSAHQFPPSGGYGLNQGVADAFSLAWRLYYMIKSNKNFELSESYQHERTIHTKV